MIGPLLACYFGLGALYAGHHWRYSAPGSPNEPYWVVIAGCLFLIALWPLSEWGRWVR